jgi:hypothetical protein
MKHFISATSTRHAASANFAAVLVADLADVVYFKSELKEIVCMVQLSSSLRAATSATQYRY